MKASDYVWVSSTLLRRPGETATCERAYFFQLDLIRLDRDSADATHGITRVDHKIQEHLLNLARIGEMELTEGVNRDDN